MKTKPKLLRFTASSSRRRWKGEEDEVELEEVEDDERSVLSDGEQAPRLETETGESHVRSISGLDRWSGEEDGEENELLEQEGGNGGS